MDILKNLKNFNVVDKFYLNFGELFLVLDIPLKVLESLNPTETIEIFALYNLEFLRMEDYYKKDIAKRIWKKYIKEIQNEESLDIIKFDKYINIFLNIEGCIAEKPSEILNTARCLDEILLDVIDKKKYLEYSIIKIAEYFDRKLENLDLNIDFDKEIRLIEKNLKKELDLVLEPDIKYLYSLYLRDEETVDEKIILRKGYLIKLNA